jgi:hypothetical protein
VVFGARKWGGIPGRKGYRPSSNRPDCPLSSVSAGGASGGCTRSATAASASHGARLSALTFAHSGKEGKSTVGVHPLTLNTGYGIVGLTHRAQDVELCLTIVTVILVDRHSYHLLQLFSTLLLRLPVMRHSERA